MILSVCFGPPESRPCADRPLVQRVGIVVVTGTGHEDRHAPSERLSGEASRDDPGPPMAGCESASISPLASATATSWACERTSRRIALSR